MLIASDRTEQDGRFVRRTATAKAIGPPDVMCCVDRTRDPAPASVKQRLLCETQSRQHRRAFDSHGIQGARIET